VEQVDVRKDNGGSRREPDFARERAVAAMARNSEVISLMSPAEAVGCFTGQWIGH
jgi:hypothetical protein